MNQNGKRGASDAFQKEINNSKQGKKLNSDPANKPRSLSDEFQGAANQDKTGKRLAKKSKH